MVKTGAHVSNSVAVVTAGEQVRTVTVFLGSRFGKDPAHEDAARKFGTLLGESDLTCVYGGGHVGLMGVLADSAMAAGGNVIGVIPEALLEAELGHGEVTRLEIVPDMHTRKARMGELGDVFVALPGGVGTLEEFFEIWTWLQLRIHNKPVGLLNVNGFWDPLIALIDGMVHAGFVDHAFAKTLFVSDNPETLLADLRAYVAANA